MKYRGLYPKLFLTLLVSLTVSGCISQKLQQAKGLLGEIFREELNCNLPPDIQIAVEERRERYEEVNDIHNMNFVILRRKECMPEDEFERLLTLRWELLRFNKQNEIALQDAKILLQKYNKNPKRKTGYALCTKFDLLRSMHDEYMQKSEFLLERTDPYKPWVIDKYIEWEEPPITCVGCNFL